MGTANQFRNAGHVNARLHTGNGTLTSSRTRVLLYSLGCMRNGSNKKTTGYIGVYRVVSETKCIFYGSLKCGTIPDWSTLSAIWLSCEQIFKNVLQLEMSSVGAPGGPGV